MVNHPYTSDSGSEVGAEPGYYARMLPPKESGVEALGGVLNGVGAMLGVGAIVIMPIMLGVLGIALSGTSLAMTRSRGTQQRFGIGFAIAVLGWLIGTAWATWRSAPLWP